jgi:hypothetical protein
MAKTVKKLLDYLHLIEAVRDGKQLQLQCNNMWMDVDADQVEFYYPVDRYRVKPELIVKDEAFKYATVLDCMAFSNDEDAARVRFTIDPDTYDIIDVQLIIGENK